MFTCFSISRRCRLALVRPVKIGFNACKFFFRCEYYFWLTLCLKASALFVFDGVICTLARPV